MKDREEWAKQAAQRRQERLSALGEARKARDAERKARLEKKGFNYEALMDRMLEDLCKLNPEWQARKEQAQRVSRKFWFISTLADVMFISAKRSKIKGALDIFRTLVEYFGIF